MSSQRGVFLQRFATKAQMRNIGGSRGTWRISTCVSDTIINIGWGYSFDFVLTVKRVRTDKFVKTTLLFCRPRHDLQNINDL